MDAKMEAHTTLHAKLLLFIDLAIAGVAEAYTLLNYKARIRDIGRIKAISIIIINIKYSNIIITINRNFYL
jgi:hypothetical protein